jgi:outer membrane protein
MKRIISAIAVGLCALAFNQCYAAELKIGIIDVNQILQKSPLMISLNAELVKKFQSRQDEVNNAQKVFQDETNKLATDNGVMSPADRTKLQNQIINDRANALILDATLQRDIAIAKDAALQKFSAKLNSVIAKIAKDGNYDLIQQNTNFAYVNSRLDITAQVLQQLT